MKRFSKIVNTGSNSSSSQILQVMKGSIYMVGFGLCI